MAFNIFSGFEPDTCAINETIKLPARDFYKVIVDEAEGRINVLSPHNNRERIIQLF